jgi:hypothetical protein
MTFQQDEPIIAKEECAFSNKRRRTKRACGDSFCYDS